MSVVGRMVGAIAAARARRQQRRRLREALEALVAHQRENLQRLERGRPRSEAATLGWMRRQMRRDLAEYRKQRGGTS